MSLSERIKELKIDSTLWTTPARIINLLDFDPKNLGIYTELNSISNTPVIVILIITIIFQYQIVM